MGGAFTWDEVAHYRERWKRPLVVKGILHPADAEKCVALGVDGIIVSNHGGRQVEGLPAPIDVLPAVVAAVGEPRARDARFAASAPASMSRARWRSAPTWPLPARRSSGGSVRSVREGRPRHRSHDRRDEVRLRPDRRVRIRPRRARSSIRHPGVRFRRSSMNAAALPSSRDSPERRGAINAS